MGKRLLIGGIAFGAFMLVFAQAETPNEQHAVVLCGFMLLLYFVPWFVALGLDLRHALPARDRRRLRRAPALMIINPTIPIATVNLTDKGRRILWQSLATYANILAAQAQHAVEGERQRILQDITHARAIADTLDWKEWRKS